MWLLQSTPTKALRSTGAAAAATAATVQQLLQHLITCSNVTAQYQGASSCSISQQQPARSFTSTAHPCSSSDASSGQQQPDPQQQQNQAGSTTEQASSAATADAAAAGLSPKQPAAAAGRQRQQVTLQRGGFATLPPHATASGFRESFKPLATAADTPSGSSLSNSSSSSTLPLQQVPLPEERLRVRLRQPVVQQQEEAGEVDVYSLSRSLLSDAKSFDTAAAGVDASAAPAAAGEEQQQQQGQLTTADRQLLEKLVGIMTKDGKKSRARRILLDAMHIIKQEVAKGQQQTA